MNIAKANILNPVKVSRDEFTFNAAYGELRTLAEVRIRRKLDGWRVRFEVSVNSILWNSDDASEADRALFDKVADAAEEAISAAFDKKSSEARVAAREIFAI